MVILRLGNLTISGSTFDLVAFTANRSAAGGTLSLDATSSLLIGGTNTFPSNYSTNTLSAGSTVNYNGTNQNVAAQPYSNLILSGSGTKTLLGNSTIGGNLTVTGSTFNLGTFTANRSSAGGTLSLDATSSLLIGGTNTFPSNYSTNTLSAGSTVNYNGTNQSVQGLAYSNLTISGSATKTLQGNSTIGNNLNISTGTFDLGTTASTLGVTGTTTIAGILRFDNTTVKTVTLGGNLSGAGTIDMSGGALSHILTLNGANNAITTFTAGSGSVIYSGAGAQQIFAGTYNNLTTQTNSSTRTIQGNITVNNNLSVSAGTLSFGNLLRTITVNGNLSGAGTIDMSSSGLAHVLTLNGANNAISSFTAGSASVIYSGSSVQQIFSGTYNNLTLNNAAGFTLSGGVTVGNVLAMTQGNVTTGANTLKMSSSVAGNLSYVAGAVIGTFQRAIGNTGVSYLFPVGSVAGYNPLKITFSNLTPGLLAVKYQPNDIGTAGLPLDDAGTAITDRQTEGFWTMTATAPMSSSNYDVTLNYSGFAGVDANSRIIKRTDGGNLALDGAAGTVINPEIKRSGLNGISTGTTDLGIGKTGAVITTQPFSHSGCNTTFSIIASGTLPLTYQWQEDNGGGYVNILNGGIYGGATTNSLTISGATVSMNGYLYRCIVTDALLYSVTSNSATLTVSLPVVAFGYNYTRDLTLNAASGSSDLTDFPALINITSADLKSVSNSGHVNSLTGYDIIFTDVSGNKLDHQIESYDPVAGQFIGWVRIPLLSHSVSTTIKMLYGNPTVSTNPSLKSVWASNYKGVWHLNGTDYTDATLNSNNGTQNATSNVTGKIAGARGFNGTTSYISVPTSGFVPNNNNQTISIWANYPAAPGGAVTWNLISFQNTSSASAIQVGFRGGNFVAWKWGGALLADGGAAPSANTWHYYVYTFDGTTSRIYVDGAEKSNSTTAPQTALPAEGNIGRYNNGEYIPASLDEPRFSMSPKSAGWIQTEFNNQNAPASFISLGAETANSNLTSVGVCSSTFVLDQGTPSGGTYSGPGVTGTNFNASVAGVGTKAITYLYTDVNGCSNSAVQNITVTAAPSAPAAVDKVSCISNILDLEATGTNLKWYTDPALTVLAGNGTPFATGKTAAGVYTYYVTQTENGCESAATAVKLTIVSGITIDTQPQPYSVCSSGDATFTVAATGFNLSYRWQENGVNISDGGIYSGSTTATLTLTGPGAAQDGNAYRCVISSTCGASPVTSAGALLSFSPAPSPSISGNITACPFESGVTYSTPNVSGNTYSWTVTGGSINGSSTGDMIVVDWGASGTGTVKVTESVNLSCTATTPDYTVNISDITLPVISGCPADININTDPGLCSAVVSWTEPTAVDDCAGAMTYTTRSNSPGDVFPIGTTIVTYTFTDLASNTSTCTFNITVADNSAPVISGCPADINANNVPGACATIVSWTEPTAIDNCTGAGSLVWTKSNIPGDLFPVGTTVVTYTVKDAAGNTSTCTFNVIVTDNQPPTAVCKDISVNLDALGNASIVPADINNGSTDNCGIASVTILPDTFNSTNIGPNTVTMTVTDVNGNISTCNSTVTVIGAVPPTAYYSYQTGNWNQASTWTTDPGGTTGPGTTVPTDNDKVYILTGRTVSLTANVVSKNLEVTINSGGILDQSTFAFTDAAGLASLKGGGVLKLSSPNFPVATINTFVTTDAGTTEYNNNGNMSATQGTYYHLLIRTAGTVTQVNNITLNGNLDVKQGIFRINDATSRRLTLLINGDVTVDNTGSISVGTGVTNTTTNPTGPANGINWRFPELL